MGWFFLLLFSGSLSTMTTVAIGIGFYAAGVAMRPMWYKPHPPTGRGEKRQLTRLELPEYWQGVTHDPKTDLGIDFEEVEFPTIIKLEEERKGGENKERFSDNRLFGHSSSLLQKLRFRRQRGASHANRQLILRGWFIEPMAGAPKRKVVVVCVHGGGRDRRAFLRHSAFFHKEGYPALLFDFREHGLSDGSGRGFTYGVKEHLDVIAAVEFAKAKTGLPLACVISTSVGATATIIAAAKDRNIDGVIAENPLTRPEALFSTHVMGALEYVCGRTPKMNVLTRWLGRVMVAIFLIRIGAVQKNALWPNHRGAVDVVHEISPRPILILHGSQDKIVPVEHGIEIFQAAKQPKDLWICQGAVHCALYDRFPKEYKNRVLQFLGNLERSLLQTKARSKSWGGNLSRYA